MTKFKLDTKTINPYYIEMSSHEDYMKQYRIDIITLGISKPSKKFFEIDPMSGPPLHT